MMIVLITNAEGREEEHIGVVVVPPLGLWEIFARLVERQDVITILYIFKRTNTQSQVR